MCGGFNLHQAILFNTSWLSYNFWHCLPGDRARYQTLGAHSHKIVPPHTHFTCSSEQRALDGKFLWPPFLSSMNFREWLTGLKETLFTFTSLLKDMIKEVDEEICGMRSGKVLSTEPSAPTELRCITIPVLKFANLEELWTLLGRLPHAGMIGH